MKANLLNFDGNLDIEGFMDWLIEVNRFFDYMDVPEERLIKLVGL